MVCESSFGNFIEFKFINNKQNKTTVNKQHNLEINADF